jgi:hypothetical protein
MEEEDARRKKGMPDGVRRFAEGGAFGWASEDATGVMD